MTTTEYNKCVDLYSDNIYRFALKNVRDVNTANDIVQDTYLRLWQHVKEVDFERVKSYLFRITNNLIIDLYRKNKFIADIENISQENYSYNHEYSDLKESLDKAIKTLSNIQRTVILLRDYEGYSYDEIGEITGLTQSQVKVYIYRGRKKMKDHLIKSGVEL
ncbi:MAG TPA: RNA polymerase sigma factor [Bacteroidetes bacterium]|nr:RNA polymerase sigma factor [Bacteroidota bacterium]